MLYVYMFVTIFLPLLVVLAPIAIITLLIVVSIHAITGSECSKVQAPQQKQISVSEKQAKDKAEFAALPKEKQFEILTQKYLTLLCSDYAFNSHIAEPAHIDFHNDDNGEENIDAAVTINNRLKGFFGFEYNEFFEGFAMNEETDEGYVW